MLQHAQQGIPVALVRLRCPGGEAGGSSTEATRDQYQCAARRLQFGLLVWLAITGLPQYVSLPT